MPDWILLLPLILPLLGALALTPIAARVSARARLWLAAAFLTTEILAILATGLPGTHRLAISTWDAASFAIALQCDGVTLLLLLTICAPLLALWLVAPPRPPFDLPPMLVLITAMLLTMADGLTAVYLAWVMLDIALFAWRLAREVERETALRALALSQLTALLLFGGVLLLSTPRASDGALLIALALWARLGLFPFHWLLPTPGMSARDLWLARGIPTLAAASLWLRWDVLHTTAPSAAIGVLAAAALAAALIWIWREEDAARASALSASHASALIPLAIAFGKGDALAMALWLTLSASLGLALLALAQEWRAENRNRYPRLLWFAGMFTLAGLPLTPAFLGRIGLYVTLWESGEWLLLLIAGATTLLILASLWNLGCALIGAEAREPKRAEYAGLVVATVIYVAYSLAPPLIVRALGENLATSADRALERVIWTNDAPGVAIGFALLLLPVIASFFLRRAAHSPQPRPDSFSRRAARALDLDWLARALSGLVYRLGATARNVQTIAEENPTLWLLFVGLWVALFILMAR